MQDDIISRIAQLAGKAVAEVIRDEFGGSQPYIARRGAAAAATHLQNVRWRISSRFDPMLSVKPAVLPVAAIADIAKKVSGDWHGVQVEVETRGIGQSYMGPLGDALAYSGIAIAAWGHGI